MNVSDDAFVPFQTLPTARSLRERTDTEQPDEFAQVDQGSQDAVDPYPQTGAWYEEDFDWRTAADGRRFLTPKRAFVNALIESAPKRLTRAYELLSAEDREQARLIAKCHQDTVALLGGIDTFQAEVLSKWFAGQAARQAARAASLRHSAVRWNARLRPGQEAPERLTHLIQLVGATAKTAAILLHVARQMHPDVRIDYKQACWETARINAYSVGQRLIDPKAQNENANSASAALLDAC